MQFKYHGAYKGFYLFDGEKFVKPFKRLDIEATEKKAAKSKKNIELLINKIVEIKDSYVVFKKPQTKKTSVSKSKNIKMKKEAKGSKNLLIKTDLTRFVPKFLLENLSNLVEKQEKSLDRLPSVLEIIDNILYSDAIFRAKAKKLFYYKQSELVDYINRYIPINKIDSKLEADVNNNYPNQYVYEHLPLDYKEKEMIYVFYFIILIELLSILK